MLARAKSLCPQCYRIIDARLFSEHNAVYIEKSCCSQTIKRKVENDIAFFEAASRPTISTEGDKSILIDITKRCNTTCKYCFYPINNQSIDPSINELEKTCEAILKTHDYKTIILFGGEPTVREDLFELVGRLEKLVSNVGIYTNCIKLQDKTYLRDMANSGLKTFNFSLHPLKNNLDRRAKLCALDHIREFLKIRGEKEINYASFAFTVERLDEMDHVMTFIDKNRDIFTRVDDIRIRLAINIGAEEASAENLYLSDLVRWVYLKARQEKKPFAIRDADNNLYHMSVIYDGYKLRLISWPNKDNIILERLEKGASYLAGDGNIYNFVITVLVNEAIGDGVTIETISQQLDSLRRSADYSPAEHLIPFIEYD